METKISRALAGALLTLAKVHEQKNELEEVLRNYKIDSPIPSNFPINKKLNKQIISIKNKIYIGKYVSSSSSQPSAKDHHLTELAKIVNDEKKKLTEIMILNIVNSGLFNDKDLEKWGYLYSSRGVQLLQEHRRIASHIETGTQIVQQERWVNAENGKSLLMQCHPDGYPQERLYVARAWHKEKFTNSENGCER
ncbi:6082_t:CDS:2 [Ambispora gerdemannii]|uniref:6082_t:CDS:1 n=1 Tax=Ambispora gerdemannii TaxID=144530 RepID=A0A9N9CNF3_9GLOM|nr:6082_t:CDS:2 [Ambispora gerdemannii]